MVHITRAAGVAIQDEDGFLFVMLRRHNGNEGNLWGIPGGKCENDEEPVEAAAREVREEAGIALDSQQLTFVDTFARTDNENQIIFYLYRLHMPRMSMKPSINPKDHTAFDWAKPEDLYARNNIMIGLRDILEKTFHLH